MKCPDCGSRFSKDAEEHFKSFDVNGGESLFFIAVGSSLFYFNFESFLLQVLRAAIIARGIITLIYKITIQDPANSRNIYHGKRICSNCGCVYQ